MGAKGLVTTGRDVVLPNHAIGDVSKRLLRVRVFVCVCVCGRTFGHLPRFLIGVCVLVYPTPWSFFFFSFLFFLPPPPPLKIHHSIGSADYASYQYARTTCPNLGKFITEICKPPLLYTTRFRESVCCRPTFIELISGV